MTTMFIGEKLVGRPELAAVYPNYCPYTIFGCFENECVDEMGVTKLYLLFLGNLFCSIF